MLQIEQSVSTIACVGLIHRVGFIYWYSQIVGGLQHPDWNIVNRRKKQVLEDNGNIYDTQLIKAEKPSRLTCLAQFVFN